MSPGEPPVSAEVHRRNRDRCAISGQRHAPPARERRAATFTIA